MTTEPVARTPLITDGNVPTVVGESVQRAAQTEYRLFEIVGWAMTHQPTLEAYRRCTGDDVGPALDRYRAWLEENIIGAGEDIAC